MKQRSNYYAQYMSDDYERLVKLLDTGNVVVCFVDYYYDSGGKKILFRDVAKVKANNYSLTSSNYGYTIESRGCVYGTWTRKMQELRGTTFNDECERLNLQYIDYE